MAMNEGDQTNVDTDTIYTLHLFAGAGGGILGDLLLGHIPVGAVEIEAYPRKVLLARQLDGSLPRFPIWDDVCTFRRDNPDTASYIERLRGIRASLCICGGFPCQDISAAGKGAGLEGERSGLWAEMLRIIGEIRPRYVFVENSPMLTIRGLGVVLGGLAEMGMDAQWGCIPASYAGACHGRDRIWILANSMQIRRNPIQQILPAKYGNLGNIFEPDGVPSGKDIQTFWGRTKAQREFFNKSELRRVDDGMGGWVDRLSAIGNGQVPAVVRLAWEVLR